MSLYNDSGSTTGLIMWDGAASTARDLSISAGFHVDFEVTATLAADTVFEFQEMPALASDNCQPDVAQAAAVLEGVLCDPKAAASAARITIPAGTVAGSVCSGRPSCFTKRFVRVVAISGGTANVNAVGVFSRRS